MTHLLFRAQQQCRFFNTFYLANSKNCRIFVQKIRQTMVTKERIEELRAKAKEELAYKKAHRKELLIKHLEEMKPFQDEYIPSPPKIDKETYDKYVIPNFIRCGAIPTEKLIVGKKYYGSCRNASVAVWLGDKFEYQRTKFGSTFSETINNFDNDDGYDLFVPIRLAD